MPSGIQRAVENTISVLNYKYIYYIIADIFQFSLQDADVVGDDELDNGRPDTPL